MLARPEPAARQIARAAGQADLGLVRAQLSALRPVIVPPMRLDRAVLERWADFDARFGIVRRRPDVDRAFAFEAWRALAGRCAGLARAPEMRQSVPSLPCSARGGKIPFSTARDPPYPPRIGGDP